MQSVRLELNENFVDIPLEKAKECSFISGVLQGTEGEVIPIGSSFDFETLLLFKEFCSLKEEEYKNWSVVQSEKLNSEKFKNLIMFSNYLGFEKMLNSLCFAASKILEKLSVDEIREWCGWEKPSKEDIQKVREENVWCFD